MLQGCVLAATAHGRVRMHNTKKGLLSLVRCCLQDDGAGEGKIILQIAPWAATVAKASAVPLKAPAWRVAKPIISYLSSSWLRRMDIHAQRTAEQ